MRVSIIIPVYNVSDYVERCINSVMAQTYTDLECIIVDDCTPDDSVEKCERLIAQYNGPIVFKIMHHDHNRGLSAARNTGTDAAHGEYIFYLDSDDEITSDCIALMVAEAERHPEVEMVSAAIESIPHNDYYDKSFYSMYHHFDGNWNIRATFFAFDHPIHITAWNKLIKQSFISKTNLSFIDGILSEDEVWTFSFMLKCHSLSILPNKTYIHYDTANSIMNSFNYNSRCETLCTILDKNITQIGSPLARLQIYYCIQHLFEGYQGVRRKRYAVISRHLALLLFKQRKPLLSVQTIIYFRFYSSFHLKKYHESFFNYFNMIYQKESTLRTISPCE